MAKVAWIFPGQGAQRPGMGKDIYEKYPEAHKLIEGLKEVVSEELVGVMFEGPMETLTMTDYTQPALFLHSVMVVEVLKRRGVNPDFVAGHSIGEYAALVAAGVLTADSAAELVTLRGRFMAAAARKNPGGMSAVLGLAADKVREICDETGGSVVAANFNCPGQVVISGEKEVLLSLEETLKAAGARRVLPLPVSGAWHSPLMMEAQDKLSVHLDKVEFKDPQCGVVSNVTGRLCRSGLEIRDNLKRQICSPVLWEDSVRTLLEEGTEVFHEIGSGPVLLGLLKRIDRDKECFCVSTAGRVEELLAVVS